MFNTNSDLNKSLEKFKVNYISLDKKDIEACSKSRENFLKKLKNKIREDKNGPQLYAEEPTINFGSRFDGTQYGDLDEMDVMLVIDSNNGSYYSDGETIGIGLGSQSPNHKYDERFKKSDGSGVSGQMILNWIKRLASEVIEEGYSASVAPIRDGQAIRIEVKSLNLIIDLVPAGIFEHSMGRGTFYNISNGTSKNSWILTNPKADKAIMSELNNEYSNFCDVIRVIKYIKDSYNITLFSHAIKSSVADYAQNSAFGFAWSNNFWDDLIGSLEHLESSLRNKHIPDLINSYVTSEKENLISSLENNIACADKITKAINRIREVEDKPVKEQYSSLVSALSNRKIILEKSESYVSSSILGERRSFLDDLFLD